MAMRSGPDPSHPDPTDPEAFPSALLIDLDDTLLDNDIERFLPAYLKLLGEHLAPRFPPEQMISALLRGTQAMLDNRDPQRTLHQTFADVFYPLLDTTEQSLHPDFESFYRDRFPLLRSLTLPRPDAPALVQQALDASIDLVIATNPLFPPTAIEQRLAWAGVPAGTVPYRLITHYQNMHFTKPHPEYFAEILGLLGLSPTDAAMIGNNPQDDLEPARLLGLAVFHVGSPAPPLAGGDLRQAAAWLPHALRYANPAASSSPPALLALLRGHLAAVHSLTSRLDPGCWLSSPGPGQLTPNQTVCHLRDVETEVHLPRLQAFLRTEQPFFSAVDSDRWIVERAYDRQDGAQALRAFFGARHELLRLLESLAPDEWQRPARHALLGPLTLAELVRLITDHDRLHLAALRHCLPQPRID